MLRERVSSLVAVCDPWLIGTRLFQFATTPFKGKNRKETFDNIMNLPVQYPYYPRISS